MIDDMLGKDELERIRKENDILRRNLKKAYEALEKQEKRVKEMELLESLEKPRILNERGAGRKAIFDEDVKVKIREKRKTGITMRQLAKEYNCSASTIHKIVHENKEEH